MATAGKARQLRDCGDTDGLFELLQEYQVYNDKLIPDIPNDHLKDNDE